MEDHHHHTATIAHTWLAAMAIAVLPIVSVLILAATKHKQMGRTVFAPPKRREPPVAEGAPLLGVLPAILTRSLQGVICDQYLKLGSVFTLSSLGVKVTFLVGPEVSAHFFHAAESEISIGDVYKVTVPIFGKGVGYDVDNDTRNEQHRFFADTLRPAKLRSHARLMVREVEEYFARWGQSGTVDLKQQVEDVLLLIASRCLLGKEVRDHMHDEVSSLLRELIGGLHLVSLFFPYLPTPAHRRRDRARARLEEIFSGIARLRRSSCSSGRGAGDDGGGRDHDMLQGLLDSRYRDGRSTTEAEVTGLLVALLFAGHHTSATVTTWTAARLLRHTEWLHAATEEQRRRLLLLLQRNDQNDAAAIDYDVLLRMDVLHRSVKEALRLHPVTPMILRRARRPFTVRTQDGAEYEVPEGRMLASPLVVNNLLQGIYRDPDVFDPDRFAAWREEDRVGGDLAYTSFGAGKHACMGEGYAYLQIKVILSHLLRNFELRLLSPFPETENMISMRPKGEVMVSYRRRPLLQ
jgi:sterol 14alpha-demethylase